MRSFVEWLYLTESKQIPEGAVKIHLPKVQQTTKYSCGAAALRAVCGYFGVGPEDEEDFIKILNSNPDDGTMPSNIINASRHLGLHAFGRQHMTIDSLKKRLEKRIPVICALQAWGTPKEYENTNSGHYVVAIGFDDEKIYFEDPSINKSRGFLPYRDFLNRWHDKDAAGKKYDRFGIAIWTTRQPENPNKKKDAKVIESVSIE